MSRISWGENWDEHFLWQPHAELSHHLFLQVCWSHHHRDITEVPIGPVALLSTLPSPPHHHHQVSGPAPPIHSPVVHAQLLYMMCMCTFISVSFLLVAHAYHTTVFFFVGNNIPCVGMITTLPSYYIFYPSMFMHMFVGTTIPCY